jgi:uncharacterized RDD family membrane protein YckC
MPPSAPPPPNYSAMPSGEFRNYASFGARFGGLLIDGLIGSLFAIPAIIALVAGPKHLVECTVNGEADLCNFPTAGTIGLAVLLGAIGNIAYLVILCKKIASGGSWGQKVVGIRVADANTGANIGAGKAFGWLFCHFFSGLFCYLGYLWMLWDKNSQTWHDKMVNTVVVKA